MVLGISLSLLCIVNTTFITPLPICRLRSILGRAAILSGWLGGSVAAIPLTGRLILEFSHSDVRRTAYITVRVNA